MRIQASVPGSELDAYIVPTFDEHQSEYVAESDQRRRFLSGFSGSNGDVAVSLFSRQFTAQKSPLPRVIFFPQ